jgi:hypothetical protein
MVNMTNVTKQKMKYIMTKFEKDSSPEVKIPLAILWAMMYIYC